MRPAGYSAKQLSNVGFSAGQLAAAGLSPEQIQSAGYTAAQMKAAGIASSAKCDVSTLKKARLSGVSAAELEG